MHSKNIEDAYPLSPLQQGMLFHMLYAPTAGMYVEQTSCTLRGDLDREAFKHAWQHVVERHPILRSAFAWKNLEKPLQVVGRRVGLPLEQDDWRGLPPDEQQARLDAFLLADRARGFDLLTAPLLRLALFQVAEDACYFVWTHHHILLDGWSLSLVLDEVFSCYLAFADGQTPVLPHPRPYREYIAWLQRLDHAQAEAFWRQTLRGLTAPTPLGIDLPLAPAAPPASAAVQQRRLSPSASAALDQFVREQRLTLNTLVQGAWALLLSCYSAEADVLFGVTVAGRPPDLPDSATMIGLFINTLPLRIHLPPHTPLLPWLHQLQTQQVELRQYEHSALVQVQGWSEVPRRLPLFESLLVFENYPVGDEVAAQTSRPRLALTDLHAMSQTNYPLTIVVVPSTVLLLEISYDSRRFTVGAITRLLGHLETLLAAMVATPQAPLADLPLLTPAERRQVLEQWNATAAPFPHDQGLHQLVAAQAARSPHAVALVFDRPTTNDQRPTTNDQRPTTNDQRPATSGSPLHPFTPSPLQHLTYRELLERANRLAQQLHAMRVGPDALVALCLERSLDLVVAILGVLHAGAAYLPLDPAYPAERLAFMLEDSGVAVLLTQKTIYDLRFTIYDLPADNDQVRELKTQNSKLKTQKSNPVCRATPDNLAYVIYTSGSTGTPKGVMVSHRGLVNFAIAVSELIGLRPGQRFLQFASFSFDASALQVFPTLISGATLVLHRDPTRLSNQELLEFCARQQITVLDLPASFWQQWVEDLAARNGYLPNSIEVCMTGGERITQDRLRTWARLARRPVRFFSSYGPTEATITTTLFSTCSDQVDRGTTPDIPLGPKLPNTQIFLLDRHMSPVPIGVAGEIYIGGMGLARGYLRRPDLTAERFIPNPFAQGMGDKRSAGGGLGWGMGDGGLVPHPPSPIPRLYRTGDLARYQEDGNIEFLGRADRQAKVRGFRIEPAEIEALLREHPAVREAVVLVREDVADDKRLVAYVVPEIEDRRLKIEDSNLGSSERLSSIFYPLSSELRAFLQAKLPDYMVPAALIALEALPLTPNGKLDRQSLPAPDGAEVQSRQALVAPRDPLELQLIQIWEELLKVHPIGVTDNFFDLGGHSLLAVGLMAQIQKQFKQDLALSTLFQGPTVEQMAGLLRAQKVTLTYSPLVRIQPGRSKHPLFLVHPAGGNVLCFFRLAQHLGPDQPCYGLQAYGFEEGQEPLDRIDAMAEHYIDALRAVQPEGPYLVGGWSTGGIVAFEIARRLCSQGHSVAVLALLDTQAPLLNGAAPPFNEAMLLEDVIGQERLPLPFDEFQQLDSDERLNIVLTCLKQVNALPPDASLHHARRLLNVFKANVTAVADYVPQIYPGQITLFTTEASVGSDHVAETTAAAPAGDPTMGWHQFSAQPVKVYPVPGTHATLIYEPHVRVLAEQLRTCLDTLQLQPSIIDV